MGALNRRLVAWYRRDLRLYDNPALSLSVSSDTMAAPVFIIPSPYELSRAIPSVQLRFLFKRISELSKEIETIGGQLIIRQGEPEVEIPRLICELNADGLCFSQSLEPSEHACEERVCRAVEAMGAAVFKAPGSSIQSPDKILTAQAQPFQVFTPYLRKWRENDPPTPIPAPTMLVRFPVTSESIPSLPQSDRDIDSISLPDASESSAQRALDEFLDNGLIHYSTQRDFPGIKGTSRLSLYLSCGVLSAAQVYRDTMDRALSMGLKADVFTAELAWRDFYRQILHYFPYVEQECFKTKYNDIQWGNDEELFTAWKFGQTGYPFIDAAMRQLLTEGWMHNRARMVTASFLTKDLHINWQWGEKHFKRYLLDADLSANNGGWQWSASTGTDAQPWFRIFNPTLQAQRFDPNGDYIRQYCPELKCLPSSIIHRPWMMSELEQKQYGVLIGRDYPAPIVDHTQRRQQTLNLYKSCEAPGALDAEAG